MNFSPGTVQILQFIQNDWKLILILTLLIFIYYYYTNTFDYFEKRGVPFKKPIIFLGNLGPRLKAAKSFHQYQLDIYQYFKGHPYGGEFFLMKNTLDSFTMGFNFIKEPMTLKHVCLSEPIDTTNAPYLRT